jgi:hypothetical protein
VEEGDERGHGCLIGETEGGGLSVNEHKRGRQGLEFGGNGDGCRLCDAHSWVTVEHLASFMSIF